MKKHQTDRALFLSSYLSKLAHFWGTIKPGARGEHIKMFMGDAESRNTGFEVLYQDI